jgi:hypothetical protein
MRTSICLLLVAIASACTSKKDAPPAPVAVTNVAVETAKIRCDLAEGDVPKDPKAEPALWAHHRMIRSETVADLDRCQALCREAEKATTLKKGRRLYYRVESLPSIAPKEGACPDPQPSNGPRCWGYACRFDVQQSLIGTPCSEAIRPSWLPGGCR